MGWVLTPSQSADTRFFWNFFTFLLEPEKILRYSQKMLSNSGIYIIRCKATGELYVGGTKRSFHQRFVEHRTHLRCGTCRTPRLQTAYDTYGEDGLEFIPIKTFPPEEVHLRELEAIAFLKPALNVVSTSSNNRAPYMRWPPIEVRGEMLTVPMAARKYGLSHELIRSRVKRGLVGEDLIAPAHKAPRKPYVRRK